jgi:hypothetical protein
MCAQCSAANCSGHCPDRESGKTVRALKPVQQFQRGRCIVRLTCGQAEPERQALPVDDRMDLGREAASGATETMISTPFFSVAACWCARMEVLSIIWMSPS